MSNNFRPVEWLKVHSNSNVLIFAHFLPTFGKVINAFLLARTHKAASALLT